MVRIQYERGSTMENITKVGNYTVTGKFDISGSFKADGDSTESKTVTLRFIVQDVPLIDLITPALSSKKIAWVNGPGRTRYDAWKDRSIIEVDYTSPAKRVITREERIEMTRQAFLRAGLKDPQATELATKSVDNPEITT